MSSSFKPNIVTKKAGGAITIYRAVKYSGDNNTVVQAGAGDQAVGVAQSTATASGDEVEVAMFGGGGLWECGGTIAGPGLKLCKSDANGKAVLASDTDWAVGKVDSNSQVTGDIAPFFCDPGFAGATQS